MDQQSMVRAARGAITVHRDERDAVLDATERLLGELLQRNGIAADDVVSVVFTATGDLRSAFPAEAARRMGMADVPLLCARELDVVGAMPSVIRVLLHFHTLRPRSEVVHVYLEGARSLRDDLA
ncbi:MAG TPA: chorismate mutase [Actinomycetota bacterium]|jgi:chorismate mutase